MKHTSTLKSMKDASALQFALQFALNSRLTGRLRRAVLIAGMVARISATLAAGGALGYGLLATPAFALPASDAASAGKSAASSGIPVVTAPGVPSASGASSSSAAVIPGLPVAPGTPVAPLAAGAQPASGVMPMVALPDFATLVDKVGPAVVNIRTTERVRVARAALPDNRGGSGGDDGDMSEFFRRFFGIPLPPGLSPNGRQNGGGAQSAPSETERDNGVGSGFILSADGYVMTNAHVVEGADTIYVTLTDRREFKARLIGMDKPTDVAVLKIDATRLPTVVIGDSEQIRAGEWVLAIGSPFGLDNSVTAGIVSAKSRYTGEYLPFIQTDVAVNPGNSGGPLINMRGEVIGINSQIYSRTGGFMGISFSIPIDEAMRVADQLKTTGVVTRGKIGVQIGPVNNDVADSLGLPRAEGALVSKVDSGGAADKAGVQPGDIILNYDGHAIDQYSDLPRLVGGAKPGSDAPLTIWRKGRSQVLIVTVGQQQAERTAKAAPADPAAPARPSNPLGLMVADLTPEQAKMLDGRGVQVMSSEGPAAAGGIQKGDFILRLGNNDVANAKDFDAQAAKLDARRLVAVMVRRGDATQFVALRPRAQKK